MKAMWIVARVTDPNGVEMAQARIPLEGDLIANVNADGRFEIECFVETREYVATRKAPFWDGRDGT
jgi:hypothetical protein